ncbi:MAG TPA: STAS domain-containing protein [Actinomycetota bacterium]|nr:STAS domain-containing protein [Actinomycetota bacterium]
METNERPRLLLDGPIARNDIPALCQRVHVLVERCAADPIPCDVGGLDDPDALTVDVLARLQLTALRRGRRLGFRDACGELRDLVEFLGLGDVLPCAGPCADASGLEPSGQSEQREQALGVEEEGDPRDRPL